MAARKILQAQKREEQLLAERKSCRRFLMCKVTLRYFEERRKAERKNRELYEHSAILPGNNPKAKQTVSIRDLTAADELETEYLAKSLRIK
eukprot:scaffold368644_cov38-Prasinocladus_malaysianus.AAC.1